ncbi:MAG: ADP/ATP-dependent (S)-NAD(P)H-hydrate dehydratase [Microbacteriaceae bacterium]
MNGTGSGRAFTAADARRWIAVPEPGDDKYARGVLGVITGSATYPGAAVLGVEAAVRTGLGMVRYLGAAQAAGFVLQRRPEVVTAQGRVQAWLIGSGMDAAARDAETTLQLQTAVSDSSPVVLDAGALDLVDEAEGPTIITPHFRELSVVLGAHGIDASADDIASEPAAWAARAADLLRLTVLLKGHTTIVAAPDAEPITVCLGTSWLATAGTGDVLGGILGALVATHARLVMRHTDDTLAELAATAAAVHGLAARRASAGGPIAALDVAEAVPATIAALLGSAPHDGVVDANPSR